MQVEGRERATRQRSGGRSARGWPHESMTESIASLDLIGTCACPAKVNVNNATGG